MPGSSLLRVLPPSWPLPWRVAEEQEVIRGLGQEYTLAHTRLHRRRRPIADGRRGLQRPEPAGALSYPRGRSGGDGGLPVVYSPCLLLHAVP